MSSFQRRGFLGSLAFATGQLAGGEPAAAQPAAFDGHAAGRAAAPFADGQATIPRKPGDAPGFVASLDRAALKATSGGWAREITSRQLPLATGLAMAHLFLNPGGCREMHWHDSAEWAYVIAGRAQVTAVDPDGEAEVFNVGAGDLWYFPRGCPHAIQTIGSVPCHALLAFNDGLYSEHGTFGLTDWISRLDPAALSRDLGVPASSFDRLPAGETYIMQGEILPEDSAAARGERRREAGRSMGYGLLAAGPAVSAPGGALHIASAREFPASAAMTGLLLRLESGAAQALHWHPGADEMHYVLGGQARFTLFAADKHLATALLTPGDCAYVPRNAAHLVEAAGPDGVELLAVQNTGSYAAATLADWMAQAPPHLLANNLRIDPASRIPFRTGRPIVT